MSLAEPAVASPLAGVRRTREPLLHDKNQNVDLAKDLPESGRGDRPGQQPEARARTQPSPEAGSLIAFLHISGGAGASTLAVNLAAMLHEQSAPRATALLDFDLQFGSVASLLDVPRSSTLQALIDDPRRLDDTGLDQMLTAHSSGLKVLPAPRIPLPLDALKVSTIAAILDSTRARFAHAVVDLPVALGPWSDVVLSKATHIYLVSPMTVPAAHNLARFFFLLQQHDLHLSISLVVNRYVKAAKHSLISPADFSIAIGRSIDFVVPEDFPLVQQSHDQGTPAVTLAPKSPFAKAVVDIAAKLTGGVAAAKHQRGLWGIF